MTSAVQPGATDRLSRSGALLIAVNLLPLLGVVLFDWDVFRILALFWLENLFIGVLGILRLLRAGARSLFVPVFFTVHYGLFMAAHGMVLVELFGPDDATGGMQSSLSFLFSVLGQTEIIVVGIAIAGSHFWSYMENYLGGQEYRRLRQDRAMTLPYRRVVMTHFALLGGGFLLAKWGEPLAGLLVLIAVKTAMDWYAHRREHQELGEDRLPVSD